MQAQTEVRVVAILLAQQMRGGPVTKESLYECLEAVDEIAEFQQIWLKAKHEGTEVDELRDATWLDEAAEKLAKQE